MNVAKAKGTLFTPQSVLYNWALDFQRYISASHPNLMHFVRACVNYLNKLLKNQSEIPSLDFLNPWFLVITSREALTPPRETNYALLEGGSPQPAFTASSNGKRKETNHGKPGNKRQQVTSVKPQGGAAKNSAARANVKQHKFLERGPNILYPKPPQFKGKAGNVWCTTCGYDHRDKNKHIFVNGASDEDAIKHESLPRIIAADKIL